MRLNVKFKLVYQFMSSLYSYYVIWLLLNTVWVQRSSYWMQVNLIPYNDIWQDSWSLTFSDTGHCNENLITEREKHRQEQMQSVSRWLLLIHLSMLIMLLCWFQPSYGEFDISGNVLGLIFNQGMIWWITPHLHGWFYVLSLSVFCNGTNGRLMSFPLLQDCLQCACN